MPDDPILRRASKSTIVRFFLIGALLRGLARISQRVAARLLACFFMVAPRLRVRRRDVPLLAGATRLEIESGDGRLAVWSRGSGPVVLLVHGWGGRGSQMAAFVEPLVQAGRRVVSFDAPAHGASSGLRTTVVDMGRAVRDVAEAVGGVQAVIAHSAGTAAVTLALHGIDSPRADSQRVGKQRVGKQGAGPHGGLRARRLVYVAPTIRPGSFLARVAGTLRVPPVVVEAARSVLERRLGTTFDALHRRIARPIGSSDLLVVHDEHDRIVERGDGARLVSVWPGAELLTTQRLGHNRILRDGGVVDAAVAFVTAPPRVAPRPTLQSVA